MALDPKAQAELADMMLALAHNPKTRAKIAAAAKEAGIPVTFNDIEASDAALAAAGKAAKDEIEKDREERRKDDVKRRTESDRAQLISSGRFTDETIKELDTFMAENGIGNYSQGVILYNHEHPPSASHAEIANGHLWEMPKGDWVKDTKGTARREAHKVIAEIAAARR